MSTPKLFAKGYLDYDTILNISNINNVYDWDNRNYKIPHTILFQKVKTNTTGVV